jgi:hypothetical protein
MGLLARRSIVRLSDQHQDMLFSMTTCLVPLTTWKYVQITHYHRYLAEKIPKVPLNKTILCPRLGHTVAQLVEALRHR